MLPREKFREIVFQLLYAHDFSSEDLEETAEMLMRKLKVTKQILQKAQKQVHDIEEKLTPIDEKIKNASKSYDFERIPRVEKNILRLGVFELFFDESIPPKVAITEAIRLAKKFSTQEGSTFVNAVLDAVYQEMKGKKSDAS